MNPLTNRVTGNGGRATPGALDQNNATLSIALHLSASQEFWEIVVWCEHSTMIYNM